MPDSKPSNNGASSFCTAVTCIDGRVQLPVIHYLTRRFHVEFVDIVSDTGPVGALAHDPNSDHVSDGLDCERVLAGGVSKWAKPDQGAAAADGSPEGDRRCCRERPWGTVFGLRRKRETVLRLLRGEDLESVSRELGITAARASQWRVSVSGRRPGQPEEPGAGRLGTRPIVGCKPRSVSY